MSGNSDGVGTTPTAAVHRAAGTIIAVEAHSPGASRVLVALDGAADGAAPAWAVAYDALVGVPRPGERVVVNTTAVDLRLGTGGAHFVIAVVPGGETGERSVPLTEGAGSGHLMKLRYTPHQCRVLAVEEEGSRFRRFADGADDLQAAPVVVCELHSQIAAVAAGFLDRRPGARVIYVMTSGGALPLWFSTLVPRLRDAGLLHGTITAGQACGGDLEAINVYSALLMARHALGADLVVAGQGPGNAGTGTRFGFSGVEQGEAANAAASLGGQPVVCLRASAADPRERHQSPSHHTLTVLDRIARCRCTVAIARDAPGSRRRQIMASLSALELSDRHTLVENERGRPGVELLAASGVPVTTMGRSVQDDEEFFLHASAAGAAAASIVELLSDAVEPSDIMTPVEHE